MRIGGSANNFHENLTIAFCLICYSSCCSLLDQGMADAPIRPLRSAWVINIKHVPQQSSPMHPLLRSLSSRPIPKSHSLYSFEHQTRAHHDDADEWHRGGFRHHCHTYPPWSDDDSRHMDIRHFPHWNGEPAAALQHEVDVTPLDVISIDR